MGQVANKMVWELLIKLSDKRKMKKDKEKTERNAKHESSKRNCF